MQKYSIGQKVWCIQIKKYKEENKRSYSTNVSGVFIEELEIIGVSPYKVCLNNDWFTTLDNDDREGYKKEKHRCYHYFDAISVDIRTNNHILSDGVFATLYSTEKPSGKLLKKMYGQISNKIDKDYGFLFSGVKDEIWYLIKGVKF